jgi:hypothetical protein
MAITAGTNRAPINARNVSPEEARTYRDQVNAESTYNTWNNNQAFNHLKDLHYTVSMLSQHPELKKHPLFTAPKPEELKAGKKDESIPAVLKHTIKLHESHDVGDVLEGERTPQGALTYGTGSRAYVGAIKHMLGSIHHPDAGVTNLLAQAQNHADNYLKQYTPATFDTNAKNKQTSGQTGTSVVVDQPYKLHVYDYPRPTEANAEDQKLADKNWAKQMKATPEGNYPKTHGYEQNRSDAQAKEKSAKNAARQKAKRAAARAARLAGN